MTRVAPCQILVVDDEREVAEMLAEMLADDGHEVEIAESALDALDLMLAQPFDVVFSDVRMPGFDGPALFRAIQRVHPALARRFVFITGEDPSDPTVRPGLASAPSIAKPFRWAEIRAVVARMVEAAERAA